MSDQQKPAAGAGRDGSRLRELAEKWRRFASEPVQVPQGFNLDEEAARTWFDGRNRAYSSCADQLDAILAVPDPLASDTGQEAEMQRLRNVGAMDVVSRFLADAVRWAECDLYAHGNGPSDGYRSRAARAREAHEAWLNRPAAPLASSSAPQGEDRFFWVMERTLDGTPAYWDGGHAESFTRNIHNAVQWCRKDDLLNCLNFTKHYQQWGWTPIEHGIMAASSVPVRASGEPQASKAWFQSLLNCVIDDKRAESERLETVAVELRRCLSSLAAASPSDDGARQAENAMSAPFAAGLLLTLKAECEAQHARAEKAEAELATLRAAASDDGAATPPIGRAYTELKTEINRLAEAAPLTRRQMIAPDGTMATVCTACNRELSWAAPKADHEEVIAAMLAACEVTIQRRTDEERRLWYAAFEWVGIDLEGLAPEVVAENIRQALGVK